jgi:lipopolysaccharide/colanic/teichoic acid biosynthesis glycosyltransferase
LEKPLFSSIKRIFDLVGSLIGLVLFAPVILFFCILVVIESPGLPIYAQVRSGKKGKLFRIIKIRSMRLDAEKERGAQWATSQDPRRLRIGAFMRRWNIDELPQFWNVLMGEMSLVGPRPERPELIVSFKETINHYNARHNITPGMTGWAAVNGLRGDTDLQERIRYDLYYMENWSIALDLQIILMTFTSVRLRG